MNDQPMPNAGGINVTPVARGAFLEMLLQREIRGIETYGTSLQTHNGRDAVRDAMEEAVDLWQYLVQIMLEREALISENAALKAEVIRWQGAVP